MAGYIDNRRRRAQPAAPYPERRTRDLQRMVEMDMSGAAESVVDDSVRRRRFGAVSTPRPPDATSPPTAGPGQVLA